MLISWAVSIGIAQALEPVYVRQPVEVMHVIELPTGSEYYHRVLPFDRGSPLQRGFYFGHGFHAVYLTRALPGRQYTLGFRYAANWRKRVEVMLFDRWPFSPGAQQFDLPHGPTLRGRFDQVELRWHLSISPESTGTLLYIMVEASDAIPERYEGFPHDLFLAWPPIESRNQIGHGVTYLQGPENILLAEQAPGAPLLLSAIGTRQPGPVSLPAWEPPGDLIINGAFTAGLQHWSPIQAIHRSKRHVEAISVGRDGLVLRGGKGESKSEVQQQLEVNVRGSTRLMLQARVKIIRQTEPGLGKSGDVSPLAISVCYDDIKGRPHCGKDAYTHRFYSLKPNSRKSLRNGQWIPRGEWYWFRADLMRLSPRPVRIRSITINGSGRSKWQSQVREIHLIRHGGKHE